jgi:hypothetical protein
MRWTRDVKTDTPDEVVRRVINAVNEHQWEVVADAAHEDSLVQFRLWELLIIRAMTVAPDGAADPGQDDRHGPEMALLQVMERAALQVARDRRWTQGLLGVDGLDELEKLAPRDLFIRWLGASYDGAIPWQYAPGADSPVLNRRVLGVVPEIRVGGNVAHVVFRQHDDPACGESVGVTTVRETPAGWRIDATDTGLLLPAARPELPIGR